MGAVTKITTVYCCDMCRKKKKEPRWEDKKDWYALKNDGHEDDEDMLVCKRCWGKLRDWIRKNSHKHTDETVNLGPFR